MVQLTTLTACGGCAAKWGGAPLRQMLRSTLQTADPDVLVGLGVLDDAAVYRLSDDTALVSTTDFFPPLVDDPGDYGAIAAANACSDVFAMGGRVVLALNLAAFPEDLPVDVIAAILDAAAGVVREAGGTVAGGHTIRAAEPIFGLAVQGLVDPRQVWTKGGARPGDRLVLSKPLGTGIALAGGDDGARRGAVAAMRTLNRSAAELLGLHGPHAVTDVTGFGLAGHAWEMADQGAVRLALDGGRLPLHPGVRALAEAGIRTGGEDRNRAYVGERLIVDDPVLETLALDPQTSGGLLAAVTAEAARALCDAGWWEVGEVTPGAPAVVVA